jgi:hypothetical protein
MDYVDKKSTMNQFTDEESSIQANSRSLSLTSESNFKLAAGKLVGTYNIKENSQIELGMEYNTIRGNGFYKNSIYLSENNIYTNDEAKFAGFAGYTTTIKKLQINLGLRYEYSHEKSTEDSVGTVKVDKQYNNIYPNLSLSQSFGRVEMSLNANARTRRPSFSELISNDLYVNPYLTQRGNPYLKKEDHYDINYNILYKILNVSLGYSYVKNPISIEFIQAGSSSANSIITFNNYDKYQNLNLLATVNYTLGFWKPQLTVGIMQPFFSTAYRGGKCNYNRTGYSIDFSNNFVLPANYIISLYFSHKSDYYDYVTRWSGYTEFDLGFRKSFFKKALNLNLYINDINRRSDRRVWRFHIAR